MSADQLLTALFNAGIVISVGATVLSLGMTFTVGELVAPCAASGSSRPWSSSAPS
jgi:hypothetical protein